MPDYAPYSCYPYDFKKLKKKVGGHSGRTGVCILSPLFGVQLAPLFLLFKVY